MALVRVEREDRLAVVRLGDPPLHLLGRDMITALREAFEGLADGPPSVVVLFCGGAGANVRELAELEPATARAFIENLHAACAAIRALDACVIAAAEGPCFGAHMEVAAVCDLRIASTRARFAMPEMRVGIPSVIDACWLAAICGLGEASRLVFEANVVDARHALDLRFVNKVTEHLERDALAWAREIARSSPVALAQQKRVTRDWSAGWYERAVRTSVEHFVKTFESGEAREAMRAFLEKREPRF